MHYKSESEITEFELGFASVDIYSIYLSGKRESEGCLGDW